MVDLKAPKNSQEPPKAPQELPKGARESPKTLSKPSLDLTRRFFKHLKIPAGKSRFLRVGGSAWELNIDPKRLRKKRNNDIEKRRTKRGEKKSIKNDKKSSKKL